MYSYGKKMNIDYIIKKNYEHLEIWTFFLWDLCSLSKKHEILG